MDEKGNKIDNAMFNWRSVEEGSSTHITAAFDTSIAGRFHALLCFTFLRGGVNGLADWLQIRVEATWKITK